jgi:hypothetical protein
MREATARQTIRTMSPSTIQVLLEFGPGVEPIAGILQPSAHTAIPSSSLSGSI